MIDMDEINKGMAELWLALEKHNSRPYPRIDHYSGISMFVRTKGKVIYAPKGASVRINGEEVETYPAHFEPGNSVSIWCTSGGMAIVEHTEAPKLRPWE